MIERQPGPSGPGVLLTTTSTGAAAVRTLLQRRMAALLSLTEGLSDAERTQLEPLVERLAADAVVDGV